MKSISGWSYNGNGNNSSGFTGLPGGKLANKQFISLTGEANFWSSSDYTTFIGAHLGWLRILDEGNESVLRMRAPISYRYAYSCRCLKD